MNEETKGVQMPVSRMSYSTLTQLCRNPIIFKLHSILGVYSGKRGVSAMIGSAAHKALEFYYGGNKDYPVPADKDEARAEGIEMGLKYLEEYDDRDIRYGKTGTREKMIQGYTQAMQIYFAEEPEYHEVLICEEKLDAEMKTKKGEALPLPGTAVPDLVVKESDGEIDIIDTKFVVSFTPYEDDDGEPYEDPVKIIQAKMLDHCLLANRGIQARRVIFREVKRTVNKDGGNQIRDYIIPLDHEPYDIAFYNFYCDCVKFISNPNQIYLPNFADQMDGREAWTLYTQGLLNADMSDVEVMHRVKEVALTSKKFVPSNLDRVENKYLAPQEKIKLRLREFGVLVEPEETVVGASVTQYRFKVSAGTRMTAFAKHKADIARAIEATGDIVIRAPIPGTSLVGIEVPKAERGVVKLTAKDLVPGTLSLPIGVDVHGVSYKVKLNEMPHLLIGGTTGSGKSILVHNLLTALTKQMEPETLDLTLIDPKRVELGAWKEIPHLHGKPIIFEHDAGVRALLELTDEMDERYKALERKGVRDIKEYNMKGSTKMLYRVVVIDEFADFMARDRMEQGKREISYTSKTKGWLHKELRKRANSDGKMTILDGTEERTIGVPSIQRYDKSDLIDYLDMMDALDDMKRPDANVELLVVRLAQLGRAAGIHMIIATQSPRVDVITGLIKANFPTRIALMTSSPTESEIILGERGAEKLTGKGDMIFQYPGANGRQRLQGFMKD